MLFWKFNWLFPFSLHNILPDQLQSTIDLDTTVSHFIFNGSWNVPLLQQLLPMDVIHKIMAIPLPLNPKPDQFIWGPSSTGCFTISSTSWM